MFWIKALPSGLIEVRLQMPRLGFEPQIRLAARGTHFPERIPMTKEQWAIREQVPKCSEDGAPPLILPPVPHISIRPAGSWGRFELKELWDYRELLYFLVWRDVKIRYKQTALGIVWT